MLPRCYDVLLRFLLIYSLLRWTFQTSAMLCLDLRFHWGYVNCIEPASVALLMGVFLWIKNKHIAREPIANLLPRSFELGFSLKKAFNLEFCRISLLGYSCGALAILPFLSVAGTFDNALKTAACCFETANQYELAERIYQHVTDKRIYSSLASWQTCMKKEDQRRLEPRNIAVARVYGRDSVQLGDRYFNIGSIILVNDKTERDDEIAYSWFENAYRIYEDNNAPGKQIACLSQMTLIKEQQNKAASSALIEKAAALAASVTGTPAPHEYYYSLLQYMAAQKGLHEASMALGKVSDAGRRSAAARTICDHSETHL